MDKEKRHIMIDLETLGTSPGDTISSIGACIFDPYSLTPITNTFHVAINIASSFKAGFAASASTILWWMEQSEEARKKFIADQASSTDVHDALFQFGDWALRVDAALSPKDVCVWGNGASFDNSLLTRYYEKLGLVRPWGPYNDRCYRTIKSENRDIKFVRVGIHHNAIDDAISQAMHLQAINCKLVPVERVQLNLSGGEFNRDVVMRILEDIGRRNGFVVDVERRDGIERRVKQTPFAEGASERREVIRRIVDQAEALS